MIDREQAIILAQYWLEASPRFLDTETTSLSDHAHICELAVIDHTGAALLDTFIKPTICREATEIHRRPLPTSGPDSMRPSGCHVIIYNSAF